MKRSRQTTHPLRLGVLHYHWRRCGVTTVVNNAVRAVIAHVPCTELEIDLISCDAGLPHSQAMLEMTRAGIGMTAITNSTNEVLGIFTDGDLRRVLNDKLDLHESLINDLMTRDCTTATADMLAAEGLEVMQRKKINALLVTDEENQLVGALNMHTLLRAGVA